MSSSRDPLATLIALRPQTTVEEAWPTHQRTTVRDRIVNTTAAGRPTRTRDRRRVPPRRAAVALAAVAITAVVSAPVLFAQERIGSRAPTKDAEAPTKDAGAASLVPETPPRPDQFIYRSYTFKSYPPGAPRSMGPPMWETWLSVDGTHDGLRRPVDGHDPITYPGCRNGQRAMREADGSTGTEPCEPFPLYRADLPTDADGMLDYLMNVDVGGPRGDTGMVVKHGILPLLERVYLLSAQRVALFQAMERIPGLTIDRDVTDPVGRPAIWISTRGGWFSFFLDRHTYQYLGMGTAEAGEPILQVAIVDSVGQRP